jgi:hypothetical protein
MLSRSRIFAISLTAWLAGCSCGPAAASDGGPVDGGPEDGGTPMCSTLEPIRPWMIDFDAGGGRVAPEVWSTGWLSHEWVYDGVRGETGCVAASCLVFTSERPPYARWLAEMNYDSRVPRGPLRGLPEPDRFCGLGVQIYNLNPLATGATGELAAAPAIWDAPAVLVNLVWATRPGGCPDGFYDVMRGAGTYTVLQGGDIGDVIEIEARNVTFAPLTDSHTFELPRVHFKVYLERGPHML